MKKARLIAFYLPQFHPTTENDEWWGKGFTEWTNVTKARPLFPGHYQPHLPADLGFYDLRVPEARAAQAELARNAGVEGFCYWHYWFAGRRLLERPFNEVVASGQPDFPFCLAWANDSWKSHWYGAEKRMLIEQTYPGHDDHKRHFFALLPAFKDSRYIRVHGRPMFTIFRPKSLPATKDFIDQWQDLARHNGLPGMHFVAHLFDHELDFPWKETGYGGAVVTNELKVMRRRFWQIAQARYRTAGLGEAVMATARILWHRIWQRIFRWPGGVHRYTDAMLFFKSQTALNLGCYPSVVPGWDNTPRAGPKGVALHGATPELFAEHLREILDSVADRPAEDRIVFIKSWNEWAEGNYLEPDRKFGHGYLNAVRSALDATGGVSPATAKTPD
jgi:lipopolysaccharide biosynthesis protein